MNVASIGKKNKVFREIDKQATGRRMANETFIKSADEIMLAKFCTAGVLLNDKFDIIQFRALKKTGWANRKGKPSL